MTLAILTIYSRRAILLCLPSARRYRRALDESGMPVHNPTLTFTETRAQIHAALPTARVRRLLQWRYELTWHKPD